LHEALAGVRYSWCSGIGYDGYIVTCGKFVDDSMNESVLGVLVADSECLSRDAEVLQEPSRSTGVFAAHE
jgi:hypothetical protein